MRIAGGCRGSFRGSPRPSRNAAETEVSSGKFSLDLYLRHREYNAAIGAALLYLSLLFLRPALGLFCMCRINCSSKPGSAVSVPNQSNSQGAEPKR